MATNDLIVTQIPTNQSSLSSTEEKVMSKLTQDIEDVQAIYQMMRELRGDSSKDDHELKNIEKSIEKLEFSAQELFKNDEGKTAATIEPVTDSNPVAIEESKQTVVNKAISPKSSQKTQALKVILIGGSIALCASGSIAIAAGAKGTVFTVSCLSAIGIGIGSLR